MRTGLRRCCSRNSAQVLTCSGALVRTFVAALVLPALIAAAPGLAPPPQGPAQSCVSFQSPGRLAAGRPYRAPIGSGLEFRLSADWTISAGPVDEPTVDYMWVVSPPLQSAPHLMIGPGYGMTARESARIERPLRFVITRADYSAARAAIALQSAGETLKRLDQLRRGHVSIAITDYRVRDVLLPDGRPGDAFDWIAFKGEACVPRAGVR